MSGTVARSLGALGDALGGTANVNFDAGTLFIDGVNNGIAVGTTSVRARVNVLGTAGAPSLSADTNNIAVTTSATSVELAEGAYTSPIFSYWMQVKQNVNSGIAWPLALQPIGGNVSIGPAPENPSGARLFVSGSATITTNTNNPSTTGWQGVNINGTAGAIDIARNGSNVLAFYHTSNAGGISLTPVGTVSVTTTSTSYSTSSDYRLKENITAITNAGERLLNLKPCRFNFIADSTRIVDGFLAHEAAEVVPEAVTGEKDAVNEDGSIKAQGIDQSKLVPLLTAALQEALLSINDLKAEVQTLKTKIAALESN